MSDSEKPTDATGADAGSERPSLRPAGAGGGLGRGPSAGSLRPGSSAGSRLTAGRAENSGGPLLPQPREQKKDESTGSVRRPEADAAQEEETDGKDEEPEEFHPLFQSWTFWFDRRAQGGNYRGGGASKKREQAMYENNLMRVGEFEDVETFWQYFNNMQPSSKLNESNYHLFRSGVKPMWEDPANKQGGKWTVHFKTQGSRNNLDLYWRNVVLAVIGELLDDHDDVMGAVMQRRGKADRIAIWNRDRDSQEKIMALGKKIKELIVFDIPAPHDIPMEYNGHDDSLKTGTSHSVPISYRL